MAHNIFRLVLTDEAQNFIESLPEAVSYKIYYNIKRVAGGERNKELFKKLENSEIWEFRTLSIKKARIEQNLTQEQLGERIGVKRAQISRLERGYSITIPTMRRVFKALGVVTATIDLGIAGKVALW